jgi:hypothetical protein
VPLVPPKPKVVLAQPHQIFKSRACNIGAVVQITLGILVEDVDGGRALLVVQSQHGEDGFDATGTAQ